MNTKQINWDRFTGQWLATVRALKRDPNYCRLARAMASADDHRLGWAEYATLAATWKGIHEDRENETYQRRCAEFVALGWTFRVEPDGHWHAEAMGIECFGPRLGSILVDLRNRHQPLREDWDRSYQAWKAKRESGQ